MASPNVTNVSVKVLALDPSLKPAEVIALTRDCAPPAKMGGGPDRPQTVGGAAGEADGHAEGRRLDDTRRANRQRSGLSRSVRRLFLRAFLLAYFK
jgi:hypothetical protein